MIKRLFNDIRCSAWVISGSLAALFASQMTGPALALEKSKTVRDWTVSCDETGCVAQTAAATDKRLITASLSRGNEANAPLDFSLSLNLAAAGQSLLLAIPGTRYENPLFHVGDRQTFRSPSLSPQAPLIAAMRDGQSLAVTLQEPGNQGAEQADLSLSGVTAALLFMDEFQGRLDRIDAIIRVGNIPAPNGNAAQGARESRDVEYSSLPNRFQKAAIDVADCNPESDTGPQKAAWRVDLPNGLVLWEASCWFAAYNFGSVYYIAPSNDHEAGGLVEFTAPQGEASDNQFSLTNPSWDSKSLELNAWHKGRGIGDCGTYERHRYEDGVFALQEYRLKECGDGKWTEPADYPLIFKAGR